MLNIEKYEEELRPFGTRFAITKHGKIRCCKEFRCGDCAFHYALGGDCYVARLKWLMKEYKEPFLTNEAKNYLKSITKPSKGIDIQKIVTTGSYKLICVTEDGVVEILYNAGTKYDEYFKNMELDKNYSMEDLDLC